MSRFGLITYEALPQLQDDDRLLLAALAGRGHDARPAIWTDTSIDWRMFDALVLRSCWDYHLQPGAFRQWLDTIEGAGVQLFNAPPIARWNMDKFYLRELAHHGVRTVPTRFFEPGAFVSMRALREATGWSDVIVKPAVSATAWRLARLANGDELPDDVRGAMATDRYLAQPFLPQIAEGEWSLIFFGGKFSHAVLKRPQAGEFRVQEEYGGAATPLPPPAGFVEAAARAIAAAPGDPLYARVDGVASDDGFLLIELELLEPALYLGAGADAAGRFADAIKAAVRSRP